MRTKLIIGFILFFLFFSTLTLVTIQVNEGKTFHDAFFITVMLFGAGEPLNLKIETIKWFTGVVMIGQTVLGLATLTIAFGLLANFLMSEKIARLIAKEEVSMENHVILCGLGNVGFRVLEELETLKQQVVIIDRGDDKNKVDLAKRRGHHIIVDNLKLEHILEEAGIAKAKSVIICTGSDLLNMELALNVRQLRPEVIIVMRMFDQSLADKISEPFNIKIAFSPAKLAAPVFAAASFDREVFQSTRVGDELFVTACLKVRKKSPLEGATVKELLAKDMVILKLISGEERLKFPTQDRVLKTDDILYTTSTLETLEEIKELNI